VTCASTCSQCNCFPFAPVVVKKNDDGFTVARDVAIQAYRPSIISYPLQHWSLDRGISHVEVVGDRHHHYHHYHHHHHRHHQEDEAEVLLYFASSTHIEAKDVDGLLGVPSPPTLYKGSLTGETVDLGQWQDERKPSQSNSTNFLGDVLVRFSGKWESVQSIYSEYKSKLTDFEFLFDENLCLNASKAWAIYASWPAQFYKVLEQNVKAGRMLAMGSQMGFTEKEIMAAATTAMNHTEIFARDVAKNADCYAATFRGAGANSHGFGLNQIMSLLHTIQEAPSGATLAAILMGSKAPEVVSADWNNVNKF
jgi:hypothetical protein